MPLPLIDIGVNLGHASFNADRQQVLDRAVAAGVQTMIVTGTNVKSSCEAQELASHCPEHLYATAGVHPHNARHCHAETMKTLRTLAKHQEVVAIGECGLDYNRDFSPRPVQDLWFAAQIELACELQMPLFLHERDAHQQFVNLLRGYHKQFPAAVVHCFTGNGDELQAYLDMGLFIGITGWICDERRGQHLRELVRQIPLDRLMLETDAPFLTPRDMQPKPKDGRNEPAFLPHVLQAVASCTGKSIDDVTEATTKTARAFFRLG
ncbi:MAG: YchF/TatD family DNA exonuclease [Acidobacteria bacterium]|nr:YchF/TatD family DNA exonuclease [Acidobacteriota bacterium]